MKIKQSDRVGYGVAEKFPLSSCVPFVASVLFASGASAGQGDCSNLTALQIPDTTITSAEYVAAANGLPGYCDLLATVAPQTDVEVRLPDDCISAAAVLMVGSPTSTLPRCRPGTRYRTTSLWSDRTAVIEQSAIPAPAFPPTKR